MDRPVKGIASCIRQVRGAGRGRTLIVTYLFLLGVMTAGAAALKADIKRFIIGFTAVFFISYICWVTGSLANIAATTPAELQKFGITWSLKLTSEAGFVVALIVGLVVGNQQFSVK